MYLQKEEELCLTHLCLIKDTNKQRPTRGTPFSTSSTDQTEPLVKKKFFYCATPSKPINTCFLSNTNQSNLECFSDDKPKDSRAFQQSGRKTLELPTPTRKALKLLRMEGSDTNTKPEYTFGASCFSENCREHITAFQEFEKCAGVYSCPKHLRTAKKTIVLLKSEC